MYKVVLYGLIALAAVALILRQLGILTYASPVTLLLMFAVLAVVCPAFTMVLGKLYKIPVNLESGLITGLILFFVLGAPTNPIGWLGIVFASIVAVASKFVFTNRKSVV